MKHRKNYVAYCLFIMAALFSVAFISCSSDDDDDDFGHHAKYSFVGKDYVYQWTLQNTTTPFKYVLHFSTDSTFTFIPVNVETEKPTRNKPAEGSYEVKADGTLEFTGAYLWLTNIRNQHITLYRAKFIGDDIKTMKVYRVLVFTKSSRVDWVDYIMQ